MKNGTDAKTCITESLFLLMKKSDFRDITVKEITQKAGVGRATYYRYFKSKEEIIKKYIDKKTNIFLSDLKNKKQTLNNFYDMCFVMFSNLKNDMQDVASLIKSHIEFLYLDYINESLVKNFKTKKNSKTSYASYFFAGSLYNISMQWVKTGCPGSIKEITDEYFAMILPMIKQCKKA